MRSKQYEAWKNQIIQSSKEKRIPICVQYELTSRCNFDCKMCYIHNQDSNKCKDRELSTEQWKAIFDEAYNAGMLFATLTGGECLLRDDFKELYLYLWKKRVMITILTNGALIDDEYIELFSKYQPDRVQITLYGSSEDGYRKVTGHSGFQRVVNNIEKLQKAGVNIQVKATPSKYSVDDYVATVKYIRDRGYPMGLADMMLLSKRDDPSSTEYYLTEEESIELSIETAKLFKTLQPLAETPEPHGKCTEAPTGLTCNAGRGMSYVTWEGIMYPCANVMVGGASLLEMSYKEAWEETKRAADRVVQAAECVGCAYQKACPKCPAYRLKDFKSGHCNPAVCEMTRRLVAAGVKKLEQAEQKVDEFLFDRYMDIMVK